MRRQKILFAPDGADGGTPAASATPAPTPADDGTGPAAVTAQAHNAPKIGTATTTPPTGAGPAAVTVVTGTKTERELALEAELEETRKAVKDRERTICEVQDKHETYRKSVEASQPRKKKVSVGWFETYDDDTTTPTP